MTIPIITNDEQLRRYGIRVDICVEPIVYDESIDKAFTAVLMRRWCARNLNDLWEVLPIRTGLWTPKAGFIEVNCLSIKDSKYVEHTFCWPKAA